MFVYKGKSTMVSYPSMNDDSNAIYSWNSLNYLQTTKLTVESHFYNSSWLYNLGALP